MSAARPRPCVPRRLRLAALLAGLLVALVAAGPASASPAATTTGDVPARAKHTATVVRTSTADTVVQVNVDIGMRVQAGRSCRSSLPGVCKGAVYHPCFNQRDPAYPACQLYTLFRVLDPGLGTDLAQGITVPAASLSRRGRLVHHDWGSKVTEVHLEVYAADPLGRYGDARLTIGSFPDVRGGTAYSAPVGHLHLPLLGALDTGLLIGRATGENGKPLPATGFKLDAFGHRNTVHRSGLLNGSSVPMYGFGAAHVAPGQPGAFSSKPLWRGAYDLHVQRRGKAWTCAASVSGVTATFDVDFRKRDLGHKGCRRVQPLVEGVPG